MRLEEIAVENFKGLRSARFQATSFSCLVGENNAGKSSVLQAIVYALNRPTSIPLAFYYDPQLPVSFTPKFTGIVEADIARLSPEHRPRIEPLINNGVFSFTCKYGIDGKLSVLVSRLVPREEKYRQEAIDEAFRGLRGVQVRTMLLERYPEFSDGAPEQLNITQAKDHIRGRIDNFPPEAFEPQETALPSGISSSISALLPEPIYIPAVKNVSDDLKTTQSTSFGRLLGLLLEDMAPDLNVISESLEQLRRMLNRIEQDGMEIDERNVRVKTLETTVERFLAENFPQVRVQLEIPPPELKTILNTAQIYIDDGSRDLIENKGDGIKRSLTFALFRAYVNQLSDRNAQANPPIPSRPLIFLFEEPELYLHPKAQRILFDTLASISNTHQMVVTTHSPLFFSPGVTAGFVRVAKIGEQPKPIGALYPVNFALDPDSAETFRLARFENSDAGFFSSRVILFEGESDDSYLKHLAKLLDPNWDFERSNISLVRVSGKGNFAKFRRFFSCFGISVRIVADLDAMFEGYQHLGASDGVSNLRIQAIREIDARIADRGIRAEPTRSQILSRTSQGSLRARYEGAKAAVRSLQGGEAITDEILQELDSLFTWEAEVARVKAVQEDALARAAIVPTIDALRREGIVVLSKGAIEDYYPANAPQVGHKPQRALEAAKSVTTRDAALLLSEPLGENRRTELEEIFAALFA